jgi:glycerophosphoryl diester phosphodiesterase
MSSDYRPLVFAHRGSSEAEPEHTLAAYQLALAEGADGLECDVRLTRDGHLVCLHDRRLDRVSDGRGPVSERTLAELTELDFSIARGTADGDDDYLRARRGVLPLETLLKTVIASDRPLRLLIETKHPNRYGGEVEHRLVAMLRELGLAGKVQQEPTSTQVTVMSFSPWALGRIRALAPELPTVMLLERRIPGLSSGRLPFGATIVGPGIALARSRPDLVKRFKDRGLQVYVWTVNSGEDLALMVQLRVDGIISDRPGFIRAELAARSGSFPDEIDLP